MFFLLAGLSLLPFNAGWFCQKITDRNIFLIVFVKNKGYFDIFLDCAVKIPCYDCIVPFGVKGLPPGCSELTNCSGVWCTKGPNVEGINTYFVYHRRFVLAYLSKWVGFRKKTTGVPCGFIFPIGCRKKKLQSPGNWKKFNSS